jgi:3-methyl-2-oxobutanoate hydroxymethyltransferase
MAEAACDAIKLEGGAEIADRAGAIAKMGIPVMGHLGLTPQSASALGGFRVQGRGAAQAKKLVDDARALEDAGVFAILLEMVPARVCGLITERSSVPIISLGSGLDAHGQLLIFHDMFGLYPKFTPKMARVYGNAGQVILDGIKQYVHDVTTRDFPQRDNWFTMKDAAFEELSHQLD